MNREVQKVEEFTRYIDESNIRSSILSGIVLGVLFPIKMLIIGFTWEKNSILWIALVFLALFEVYQLVSIFVQTNILSEFKKDSDSKSGLRVMYGIYYAITLSVITTISIYYISYTNSELLMTAVCAYFIFVPVFEFKVRILYIVELFAVSLLEMLLWKVNSREIVSVIIMLAATMVLSGYHYGMVVKVGIINQRLRKKTIYSEQDALTGLTNRRGLKKRIESEWHYFQSKKVPIAMIELDIDYFKKYNDKFGHPQGDVCLKTISETIKKVTTDKEAVVTRTGGEEFLIFLKNVEPRDIVHIALDIRTAIADKKIPHAYCAISKYVTVSMGIATIIPKNGYEFNDLYEEADKALYLAKENGRNCIVFDGNIYGRMKNGVAQVIEMR